MTFELYETFEKYPWQELERLEQKNAKALWQKKLNWFEKLEEIECDCYRMNGRKCGAEIKEELDRSQDI